MGLTPSIAGHLSLLPYRHQLKRREAETKRRQVAKFETFLETLTQKCADKAREVGELDAQLASCNPLLARLQYPPGAAEV